jgi:hypothetical protein
LSGAAGWRTTLTGSSMWVSVVTFAGFLPFMLTIGGVIADATAQAGAASSTAVGAFFSLLLAAMTIGGAIEVWGWPWLRLP